MKKFISHKELNKITKGALAVVLAGSLTLSATNAFADSGTTNQNQVVNTQTGTTTEVNSSQQTSEKSTAPTLLPGDFFYFTKILLEKIQMALSFNNVKDAHLLAGFASERLAEAESLFAKGDEKTAVETIKAAMDDMENANKLVGDAQDSNKQSEADDQKNEDQVKTDDQKNEDQVKADDQQNEDQEKAEDQQDQTEVKAEDQQNQDQVSNDQTSKDNQDEADLAEVKNVLSQNIIALSAAMNKVKNPEAKAALKRNIEKSYAHLEKLLAKLEEQHGKDKEDGNKDSDQQGKTDESSAITFVKAPSSESTSDNQAEVKTKAEDTADSNKQENDKEKEVNPHQLKKVEHHVTKQIHNKVKKDVKPVQKKTIEEIKQKQKEVKSFISEKREEYKHLERNEHEHENEQGNQGNNEREND